MNYFKIVVCFLMTTFAIQAQEEQVYESNVLDLSIQLPADTAIKHYTERDNSAIEGFVISEHDVKQQYQIMLSKSTMDDIDIEANDFKEAYLKQCNCEIDNYTERNYTNFSSTQIMVSYEDIVQTVDFFKVDKETYVFRYSSPIEDNYTRFKSNYEALLNSVIID